MSYQAKVHLRYLPVCLTGVILSLWISAPSGVGGFCRESIQERERPVSPERGNNQSREASERDKKTELESQGSSLKTKPAGHVSEEVSAAKQRKKELAMSLLEGVLESAHRITPVEYGLLTQVEAATLLWESDRDRSLLVLKKAWDRLNELFEEQKKANDDRPSRKQQRLRFAVLRRIARLSPDLLKQLGSSNSNGDGEPVTVLGKWTDEARAMMSVAEEQVDANPALAIQLAQGSLPFGLVDWVPFLIKLSAQDSAQAEQVAAVLMNRFSSISVSPVELLHLDRFALDSGRSPQLREQFFRALAIRFTQDLRPDIPTAALRLGMQTAQGALSMATGPVWPSKFQEIVSQYESMLISRSAAPSPATRSVAVDTSMMAPAKAGDTAEIEQGTQRVQRINDPKARDKEYQRLAGAAASKENLSLAEELMSKIDSDEVRRETTVSVYGPAIRKELSEADWTKAQTDALKIMHPLGRTLILDIIAQMIMRSGTGKQDDAKQVYDTALSKLQRDGATEDVAKGFLIIAKSLGTIDPDRSLEAMNWAVFVLNKVAKGGELLTDSESSGALASWVGLPIRTLRYDEVLDLTEMIGPLFKEMTKRDPSNAQSTAYALAHLGLSSLAQLGIVSELQKELRASNGAVPEGSSKKKLPVRH